MDEEEIKIKMDDSIARFFTCFGGIFYFISALVKQDECSDFCCDLNFEAIRLNNR